MLVNWLLGADMQQHNAALRHSLHAGQRQRYKLAERVVTKGTQSHKIAA
jgi:hypothetical protein